ncbi:MAG: 2,3-bisphosphoglycerate-independent phosphoglycerate mutase [Deltaproteobacteria bacterium]|nr:2,3-bisphosphoglycerate-independent phosphoglycerate mutase [Deltaproteobacteria bacterium]
MNKVCLIILDGWGINPHSEGNAEAQAVMPNISRIFKEYPHTALDCSGLAVGLPEGQMGNSEVGHLTMGAGRVVYQELTRINRAVKDKEFLKNPVIDDIVKKVKGTGGALHLMGLVSDGGVHSHIEHLYALLEAFKEKGVTPFKGLSKVFVHAFLDGRDTPPESGLGYIKALDAFLKKTGTGAVATVSGRYYAMDRDKRWDRVRLAYEAITLGSGVEARGAAEAVESAYGRGETDEFVLPTVITGSGRPAAKAADGDAVFFFNFRADRARELTHVFTDRAFAGFERAACLKLAGFVCMTQYDADFGLPVVFAPQSIKNILGEVLSRNNARQFRVSETEKYAHVTFFFNGGIEVPFKGEDRFLIQSVKDVPTYDKKPEMRAAEIAEAAVERIFEDRHSFMLMNFANGDMVGHTGVMDAAIKACEAVDKAVGRVASAAMIKGWKVIITSDHGNVEQMTDLQTYSPYTAHTTNPVPLVIIDDELKGRPLKKGGGLQDIAPTVLKLMGIPKPGDMTGEPLF